MILEDFKKLSVADQHLHIDKITSIRHLGKGVNYAAQYGAGAETLARSTGVSVEDGHKLHDAYWKKNWSLKAIADDCMVKKCKGQKWLYNPVSRLWYWLKTDKDRFNTLCQGTGSYVFDMWIKEILKRRMQLTGQFHDECIFEVLVGNRDSITDILKGAIARVNKDLGLARDMDCDVSFGDNYADIH